MLRGLLFDKEFRPQFSGHETFPLRYGWLKKVFDAINNLELNGMKSKSKDIFISEDSIARFGVGKNMVTSMRHWASACNVICEDLDGDIVISDFGKLLLPDDGLDPWLENTSTLWVLHWNIASNSSKASYIWLFSHFNNSVFDRGMLLRLILDIIKEKSDWKNIAEATVKRDIECLVRTYVNKPSKNEVFTEDQIESPLAELGIIQPINKNDSFQIRRANHSSLGNGAFLYALLDFWKKYTETQTLSLEAISYEPCSPGRVLCLDEDSVAERLYLIESLTGGFLSWSETAGLRQVIANKPLKTIDPLKFLKMDYQKNGSRKANNS